MNGVTQMQMHLFNCLWLIAAGNLGYEGRGSQLLPLCEVSDRILCLLAALCLENRRALLPCASLQFDTYRWMRKLVDDKWASACPATNCLWMAYLAEIMAAEKSKAFTTTQKRQLREFRCDLGLALTLGIAFRNGIQPSRPQHAACFV